MPRDYCFYEDPRDPGFRCHRPKGHSLYDDRGHANVPNGRDWAEHEARQNEEGAADQGWVTDAMLRQEHTPLPTALPSIALIAKRKSGKSTIAKQLVERYRYLRHSWADCLRQVFAMAYDPDVLDPTKYEDVKRRTYTIRHAVASFEHDPVEPEIEEREVSGGWLLQRIGTEGLRDGVDLDFWIKAGSRILDSGPSWISDGNEAALAEVRWVNDDTRFPNELQALRDRGFVIVGLSVDDDVRSKRVGFDGRLDSHPSETSVSLDDADFVIDTGTTIDQSLVELFGKLVLARPEVGA